MLFGESASGQTPGAHWAAGHVGPNFLLALTIWVTNIPSLVPSMFADQEVTTNNSSNLPLSLLELSLSLALSSLCSSAKSSQTWPRQLEPQRKALGK